MKDFNEYDQAFDQGREAYLAGESSIENPYRPLTALYSAWEVGYVDAGGEPEETYP